MGSLRANIAFSLFPQEVFCDFYPINADLFSLNIDTCIFSTRNEQAELVHRVPPLLHP